MTTDEKIAALERRLRVYVDQVAARQVYLGPVVLTSSDGKSEGVGGRPGGPASQRASRRYNRAGFRSRPPAQSSAVGILQGNDTSAVLVIAEDDGNAGSVPLEEGEASAYSPTKPNCRVYFDKDGALHIDADGVQDVIVNGGTAKVAVHGDATAGHTHTVTATVAAANGVIPAVVTTSSSVDTINIPGTRRFKG